MLLITINLDLGKITPLPYARMFSRRQSITIDSMAVTFLLVLLTSIKPLIALIIGCCSPSLLTLMSVFLVFVPRLLASWYSSQFMSVLAECML